jgi:type IV pilus assembly protein PilA
MGVALGVVVFTGCLWVGWRLFRGLLMLGYIDSAIGTIHAIVSAEATFARAHPDVGFTCSLSSLDGGPLVAALVGNNARNGYSFEMDGCSAGTRPNAKFRLTARPLHKGQPAHCSDESGVVTSDDSGSVAKCLASGMH